jgi:hypothetical protein
LTIITTTKIQDEKKIGTYKKIQHKHPNINRFLKKVKKKEGIFK